MKPQFIAAALAAVVGTALVACQRQTPPARTRPRPHRRRSPTRRRGRPQARGHRPRTARATPGDPERGGEGGRDRLHHRPRAGRRVAREHRRQRAQAGRASRWSNTAAIACPSACSSTCRKSTTRRRTRSVAKLAEDRRRGHHPRQRHASENLFEGADPKRMAARGKANEPVDAGVPEEQRPHRRGRQQPVSDPMARRALRHERGRAGQHVLEWRQLDYSELQTRGEQVKAALAGGNEVHITNPNGTDLKLRVQGRPVLVSDGIISADDLKAGGAAVSAYPAGGRGLHHAGARQRRRQAGAYAHVLPRQAGRQPDADVRRRQGRRR